MACGSHQRDGTFGGRRMIDTTLKLVRRLALPGLLLIAEAMVVVIAIGATTAPISAQSQGGFFGGGFPFTNSRPQRRSPYYQNPYQPQYQPQYQQPQPQWQWWPSQPQHPRREREREQPVDASKAPPAGKRDTAPTAHITVMGDSLADWLAFGLEEAFAETPELGIVRKNKPNRGLIMGTSKNEYDWAAAAREILAAEKSEYVVMMVGLADRQPIHVRVAPKPAGQKPGQPNQPAAKPDQAKPETTKPDVTKPEPPAAKTEQPSSAEPTEVPPTAEDQPAATSPEHAPSGSATYEFRSEKWAEAYAKRIDEVIAALKSKGAAVFWVGLPAIRGTRATSDMVYLNELFRGRAEKAGIVYVDIWDGFVDEGGAFAQYGPDFEGQTRRLRSGDGVHFTKAGARKLAHYVEREIRRVILARGTPIATPAPEEPQPQAKPGTPSARPVSGPVVSLTGTPTSGTDALLGGGPTKPPAGDGLANRVLVKGEPLQVPRGRADDFAWPRPDGLPVASTEPPATAPVAAAPAAATPAAPAPAASAPATPAAPSPGTAAVPVSPAPTPGASLDGAPATPAPPAAAPPAATPPAAATPAKPKRPAAKPAQRILPPFIDRDAPRPQAPVGNGRSAFSPYVR
jgi:hypothetical protein